MNNFSDLHLKEMPAEKEDQLGCCGKCTAFVLKFWNLFILALGLAILAYGVYMAIKFKAGFSVFTISIMAFGAVNALMSGLTFCLSESKCFVTMYLVVMAVIAVAELVAAFVFSIKSSRDKIVNAMEDHVEDHLRHEIHEHVTYFGYVLYGIAGVQTLAWITAYSLGLQQNSFAENKTSDSSYSHDPNRHLLDAEAGRSGAASGGDALMPPAGRSAYRDGKRAIDQKYAEKRAERAARRQQRN